MNTRNTTHQNSMSSELSGPLTNALKTQFLADMERAGLASESRRVYLDAVEKLIRHFWCSPDQLTEAQVGDYLLWRHRSDPPKGSFKIMRFALRFLFCQTLGQDWRLFKKKCSPYANFVCPKYLATATA